MTDHMQIPAQQRKENRFFIEKKVGGAIVNIEPMAFHRLSPGQETRGVFFLPIRLYDHLRE